MQLCLHKLVEIGKRKIDAASAVIPQHLCHAERVRAVGRRAVPVLVGKFLFLAGLEQNRQIRPEVPEFLARSVVFLVGLGSKPHGASQPSRSAIVAHIVGAVFPFAETPVQGGKVPRHPHLLRRLPSQGTMPDVVRRRDPANARPGIARDAARVAAVEHRDEMAPIGKLRVELTELIVQDRMRRRPVEVIGHEALVDVVRLVLRIVSRNFRAMPGIEQHALVAVAHVIEQPVQPLHDPLRRRALVEHDADLVRLEAALLQYRTHQEHVVDAAFEPVRRIRVVVDPDQQRAAMGLGGGRSYSAHRAFEGARLRRSHDVAPHRCDGIGMRKVPGGTVVQDVVRNIELLDDLLEVVRRDLEGAGQHAVVGIE
jgi:hypothetical protein